MSRIKGKNTGIERLVFSYLRSNEIYFQRHYDKIRGRPDVAIPSRKIAVFIDGDFWHGWRFNRNQSKLPEFWVEKISNNIARDNRNRRNLKRKGWKVLRVWEHSLAKGTREKSLEQIRTFLTKE